MRGPGAGWDGELPCAGEGCGVGAAGWDVKFGLNGINWVRAVLRFSLLGSKGGVRSRFGALRGIGCHGISKQKRSQGKSGTQSRLFPVSRRPARNPKRYLFIQK